MDNHLIAKILFSLLIALFAITLTFAQEQTPPPPVMGWSSWNTYRIHINEPLIRSQADAIVRLGLREVGYRYVNVDDGFFGYRDEEGVIRTHSERFPQGMKGLVDYIHSLGLKAGIYSDAGANTCGSIWDADPNGVGVGLYRYEKQDADLYFNQWEFDYIKIDYCGAGQQLELDERQRYTEIAKAIRDVAQKDVSINICRWAYPGTWAADLAASWRISADINPSWESVKYIIDKNLYLSAFATDGHYNDMDMLEVGRGLTRTEEETHFDMWCIMSSPLLIGCDLTTIPGETLELIKNEELIALNQDCLGLQAAVVGREGPGYVLAKDVEQHQGLVRAVALYNPSDSTLTFHVPLSDLELSGKTYVRDLICRKDEPLVDDTLRYNVPTHGVKILRLEGSKRIEPVKYEAEQAFLNRYDDLGKRQRSVAFSLYDGASGGVVVSNLGGEESNYAEWTRVYSNQGGSYRLTIYYLPGEKSKSPVGEREIDDRQIELTINGVKTILTPKETDRSKGIQNIQTDIVLNKGTNTIRMGSSRTWMPDLDCFTLTPLQ